ncbi:MAG: hypothetical protein Q8S01_09730, partial [Ignavibacteria bacterium]|nr:hypothetical protein [Ignavibacteria bacterium]
KTVSLKIDDIIFSETEKVLMQIKKPRNRYINDALDFYNKLHKRNALAEKLHQESDLVAKDSLKILHEFEKFDDND